MQTASLLGAFEISGVRHPQMYPHGSAVWPDGLEASCSQFGRDVSTRQCGMAAVSAGYARLVFAVFAVLRSPCSPLPPVFAVFAVDNLAAICPSEFGAWLQACPPSIGSVGNHSSHIRLPRVGRD